MYGELIISVYVDDLFVFGGILDSGGREWSVVAAGFFYERVFNS